MPAEVRHLGRLQTQTNPASATPAKKSRLAQAPFKGKAVDDISLPIFQASDQQSSGDPWSQAALTRRALDDLRDHAEVIHRRQQHPDDILHQLAERAAAWHRQGAEIDSDDVLRAVRAILPDHQPYQDLEHAIMRDRIHDAIAAMQREIAGQAYRDGFLDAGCLTGAEIDERVRELVVRELPDLLRAMGVPMQGGSNQ